MFAWQIAFDKHTHPAKSSKINLTTYKLFETKNTSVDYILVYEDKVILDTQLNEKINNFVSSLEDFGLTVQTQYSEVMKEMVFLKVQGSTGTLEHLSIAYNVDLEYLNHNYVPDTSVYFPFMATPLTVPNASAPDFERAPLALSGARPRAITQAERSLIIYRLMSETWYGNEIDEYGIQAMISSKILLAAYPLHDSRPEWNKEGHLSDRQLLARYWANLRMMHKQQPLNLVQRYFGSQIGFYFAFFGFYNKLLLPIAAIGLIFFLFGFLWLTIDSRVESICESDVLLCPVCHHDEKCNFLHLKHSCNYAKMASFFDNYTSLAFAPLISIWSTLFAELWKQEQAVYQMKWNLTSVELDRSLRNEYLANAHRVRISPVTGNAEPYVSENVYLIRYGLSYVSILVMVLILIACILSIVIYRLKLTALAYTVNNTYVKDNIALISSITGSILMVIIIKVMANIFSYISLKLTVMECHRTQTAFENSLIYKTFILSFAVNYSFLFYLTFFKENFYTYPSDERLYESLFGLKTDRCTPAGCLIDLSIQLLFLFCYGNLKNNFVKLTVSYIDYRLKKFRRVKKAKRGNIKDTKQWEDDFLLLRYESHHIIDHYLELILQYVAVTFFAVAFPLAPFLAFANNIINLRLQARNYVYNYRRPVAQRVAGLGAWNTILKFITFVGVTINICIIAFCTDTISYILYRIKDVNVPSFLERHYSVFNVKDYGHVYVNPNVTECYYRGNRYPPNHPDKYSLSANYWEIAVMKLAFVFIFEHAIIAIKVLLMSIIPDVPHVIREKMIYEERKLKGTKIKIFNEDYLKH